MLPAKTVLRWFYHSPVQLYRHRGKNGLRERERILLKVGPGLRRPLGKRPGIDSTGLRKTSRRATAGVSAKEGWIKD